MRRKRYTVRLFECAMFSADLYKVDSEEPIPITRQTAIIPKTVQRAVKLVDHNSVRTKPLRAQKPVAARRLEIQ